MTQYMLSVPAVEGEAYEGDPEDFQPIYDAVNEFNQKLQAEGYWVFAGGLEDRTTATTVDNTGDEVITTDGPYAETKEYLGGFWVIEAPSLDVALKLAAEGSKACQGRVEVRPFQADTADLNE